MLFQGQISTDPHRMRTAGRRRSRAATLFSIGSVLTPARGMNTKMKVPASPFVLAYI